MKIFLKITTALSILMFSTQSLASLMYDQNLTNGVFFGSGNSNGAFTVDRQNGIEIGLRGKLRFDQNNNPQPIYNSNGNGTYSFSNIAPPLGFGFAPNSPATSIWNWDWSIDLAESGFSFSDPLLDQKLRFLLEIDSDNTAGTNFFSFDPIFSPNDNAQSGNARQNSANMQFFSSFLPSTYTNTDVGIYDIRLSVFSLASNQDDERLLASSSIQILQGVKVSEPPILFMFVFMIIALVSRKKIKVTK